MRLERFHLRGFAQHSEIDIQFRDGEPDLIIGPNEAGKSHLMTALIGTLFGIERPERYTPWNGEPEMTGRLTFAAGDDQVVIERRFLDQEVEIKVNDESVYRGRGLVERNTAEDQRYRSMLHEWIGFTDDDVFKRTVFVGQDQMLDQGLGSFASQFKRLISGTREANYETALQDLESQLDTLIKLPGKRANRRLETLQDQLADLNQRFNQAEAVQKQMVTLVAEERKQNEELAEARKVGDRFRRLVASYTERQQATTQEEQARIAWEDLRVQIERMRRVRAQRLEQEKKRDELVVPGNPDPEEVRNLARDIDRLEPRITYISEALERNRERERTREFLEGELERFRFPGKVDASEVNDVARDLHLAEQEVNERNRRLENAVKNVSPPPKTSDGLRHALFVVSGLILITSLALGLLVDQLFYTGVGIAALVLIAGLVADRGTQYKIDQDERLLQEIQRYRQELQSSIDELQEIQARRNKLLSAAKVDTLHDLFYRAREFEATETRLEAIPELEDVSEEELAEAESALVVCKARREQLIRISGISDLEELYQRAREYRETLKVLEQIDVVEPHQIENAIDRMTAAQQEAVIARHTRQRLLRQYPELGEITPEQIAEFREAQEEAEREEAEIEKRLYQIQLDRQHLGRMGEDAAQIQLQMTEIEQEIEQVKLQAEAVALAIETLYGSVQEFQENALDPVAEEAGVHLASITDGRYTSVTLDRDTMEPRVSLDKKEGVSTGQLSRGTGDQLYLSIRAALIDALSGDRKLPMLLDDPCVNFDDDRLENAANLLAELARDRQVLLFTKDESWTQWFDPVLRLEREG